MPHSLSALLTPTRAPHARVLKHWEGRIVSLALVRHPHAHHTLAFFSSFMRLHPLLARFSRLLLLLASWLACPLLARFSSPSLAFFRPAFFSSFSSLAFFFVLLLLLSPWLSFLPQSGPPIRCISAGRLSGRSPPQAHDDPCAPKKAGVGARERTLLRKNMGGR